MSKPIHLFVSSSPDLAPEREALGQAVAELPISLGWEVRHTPGPGEKIDEALDFIESGDLYLFVLGADFAAPMGLEWGGALGTGQPVLAYRKRVLHSPSAQTLLRHSDVAWTPFESPQELKTLVTRALARILLDREEQWGLHLDEVEALLTLVGTEEETPAEPDRRRGAGRDGVILGRGREHE
ncbi:MAG: hypothetical protein GWN58_10210 [Anaerolineae bacterium]|nr:hypothetical protein [Anaerolineae bacterium]